MNYINEFDGPAQEKCLQWIRLNLIPGNRHVIPREIAAWHMQDTGILLKEWEVSRLMMMAEFPVSGYGYGISRFSPVYEKYPQDGKLCPLRVNEEGHLKLCVNSCRLFENGTCALRRFPDEAERNEVLK